VGCTSDGPALETEITMVRIGGSLEQMDDLNRTFTTKARDTEGLRSALESAVSTHIPQNWEGPAAEAFREAWNSQFKPALEKLTTALDDAAREVQNRRRAIEQAGS